MEHHESQNETRLDEFFEMFDAVEDDIAELVSDENEGPRQIGGYECLFIAFSNLRLYCENSGIRLKQIEDQYKELKKSQIDEESGTLSPITAPSFSIPVSRIPESRGIWIGLI